MTILEFMNNSPVLTFFLVLVTWMGISESIRQWKGNKDEK